MNPKSFQAGHLASSGPLSLPKTQERNEILSRAALTRQSIARLPKVELNWMANRVAA